MNTTLAIKIAIVFLSSVLVARVFSFVIYKIFGRALKTIAQDKKIALLGITKTPLFLILFSLIWFLGISFLNIKAEWITFFIQPVKWILGYGFILFIYCLMDFLEIYIRDTLLESKDSIHKHILPYSKRILKIIVVIVVVLIILQNSGINVSSLLASLGIGGLALAFGAKETLSHLFGGLTVIVDKPFVVGDWIVCNTVEGTVLDIGFRSTKLKTFYDSVIIIPNATIAESTIDNLGRRQARRTRFVLDITYDTSPEEIEAFVEGIKNIIHSNPFTKKDYYQAYFTGYGNSSLEILVNFFLTVNDWERELLEKQNIFLEILRLSKKLNISFAFPTQTLDIPSFPGVPEKSKDKLSAKELVENAKNFTPEGSLSKPRGLGIFKPPFKK